MLEREAETMRLCLLKQFEKRDWRKLSYDEIRRFLIFVFGENPGKTGDGIMVRREGKKWKISFKGRFCLPDEIHDGRRLMHSVRVGAEIYRLEAKTRAEIQRREQIAARNGVGNLKSDTPTPSGARSIHRSATLYVGVGAAKRN